MKRRIRWEHKLLFGVIGVGLTVGIGLSANQPLDAAMAGAPDLTSHPSTLGLTGEALFEKLMNHNRSRELHLQQYSVPRTYRIQNGEGKVRAESQVLLHYRAPDTKEFTVVSERGSGFVRRRVFKGLMESEVEAAAGRSRHDSAITPTNYSFIVLGKEDVDGYHCFVVQAVPRRIDKYLFEGKIWIDSNDFAVVKIEGHPAKNPSFWIKRVDFVRCYQKIGEFWLPMKDESITQVKVFGRNVLTIEYDHYEITPMERAEKISSDSPAVNTFRP